MSIRSLRALLCVLGALLLLAACSGPAAPQQPTGDLQIRLIPAPEANAGDSLTVVLTDAGGDPITDAAVALEGNMNHAGMAPVITDAVHDADDGSADGRYQLPFRFTMFGDWIITVNITQADGTSVSRDLDVQVSDGSVSGDAVAAPGEDTAMDHGAMDGGTMQNEEAENGETENGEPAGVQALDPRARPAPLAGGTGVVYLTLHNGSDAPVTLTGGETPAAAAVEVHETIDDNGVMRMQPRPDGVEIAPGEAVDLKPGGIHLMLVDLAEPLEVGDSIELTLHFEGAEDIALSVPVVTIDESMQEMDAGDHNH